MAEQKNNAQNLPPRDNWFDLHSDNSTQDELKAKQWKTERRETDDESTFGNLHYGTETERDNQQAAVPHQKTDLRHSSKPADQHAVQSEQNLNEPPGLVPQDSLPPHTHAATNTTASRASAEALSSGAATTRSVVSPEIERVDTTSSEHSAIESPKAVITSPENKPTATETTTTTTQPQETVAEHPAITSKTEPISNNEAVITGPGGTLAEDGTVSEISGQLAIPDPDAGEDHFSAETIEGAHGALEIAEDGAWSYSLNNENDNVQQLDQGDTVTDTLTITSVDGTSHDLVMTINGTNDAPVIETITEKITTEDAPLVTGTITATDVNRENSLTFTAQGVDGLTFNEDGSYSFDPSHASYQTMAQGETQTLSIQVTTSDTHGATDTQNLVITLTGTNDSPSVSGAVTLPAGTEDISQSFSAADLLANANDIDSTAPLSVANVVVDPSQGILTANSDSTFTFIPKENYNGEVAISYDVTDGVESVSTTAAINLEASADEAVITGTGGNLAEDGTVSEISGQLAITDPDAGENHFSAETIEGAHGALEIAEDGAWSYSLNNENDNVQQLDQGETITDTLTITSVDGTSHDLVMTINGTNDAPVIETITEKIITEDGPLVTGAITATDIDREDSLTYTAQGVDGLTFNEDGSYSFDPSHASYQTMAQGETQTLSIQVTTSDTHGATDTQNLVITLTGTNDSPSVSGAVTLPAGTEDISQSFSAADLLANANDIDSTAPLSVANVVVDSSQGILTVNSDSTFTFIPKENYNGEVAISYDVTDGVESVSTTAAINLEAVNDEPVITDTSTITVTEDSMDGFPNSGEIWKGDVYSIVTQSEMLEHMGIADTDSDSFTVSLAHSNDTAWHGGIQATDSVFTSDTLSSESTPYDETVIQVTQEFLDNYPNVEAEVGDFYFDHVDFDKLSEGEIADIDFSVQVSDGQTPSAAQDIHIQVTGSNDTPTVSGTVTLPDGLEDNSQSFTAADLLVNASDIDTNNDLTITNISVAPEQGTVTDNGDGTFNFTPETDFNGEVTLNYDVTDGTETVATAANLSLTPQPETPSITSIEADTASSSFDTDSLGTQITGAQNQDENGAPVTVTGIYTQDSGINLLDETQELSVINDYREVGDHGYNYMGGHNYFQENNISTRQIRGGIVTFSDGTTGIIDSASNGVARDRDGDGTIDYEENAYIYYKAYDGIEETNPTNVSGAADPGTTIELFDNGIKVGESTADDSGQWSFSVPLSAGEHNLTSQATDENGANSGLSENLAILTGEPDLAPESDSGRSQVDNLTNDQTVTLDGSGASSGETITIYDEDGQAVGNGLVDEDGKWSVTTETLTEGEHALSATVTDGEGTESTATESLQVTIDTTAPEAPEISAISDSRETVYNTDDPGIRTDGAANGVTVTGLYAPDSSTNVLEGKAELATDNDYREVGDHGYNYMGGHDYFENNDINTGQLRGGVITFSDGTTGVIDSVSNGVERDRNDDGVIDDTIVDGVSDYEENSYIYYKAYDDIEETQSVTINGTSDADSTVEVFDGETSLGVVQTDMEGNWDLSATGFTEGTHSITATATDTAGNLSSQSQNIDHTIHFNQGPSAADDFARDQHVHLSGNNTSLVADSPIIEDNSANYTVSLDITPEDQDYGYVISNGGQTGAASGFFVTRGVYGHDSSVYQVGVTDEHQTLIFQGGEVVNGEESNLTFTFDGQDLTVFQDGVDITDSGTTLQRAGRDKPMQNVSLGAPSNILTSYEFQGDTDNIQMYDKALEPSEVNQIQDGIIPDQEALLVHYTFDEDNALTDLSGNGHDLQAHGDIQYGEELDAALSTTEDADLTIPAETLLANDTNPDGGTLSITAVSEDVVDAEGTVLGTATQDENGNIVFTPGEALDTLASGENKEVSFSYTVSDGIGGTDTATATINVEGTDNDLTHVPETAGYKNVVGIYETDESGTMEIQVPSVDLALSDSMSTGDSTQLQTPVEELGAMIPGSQADQPVEPGVDHSAIVSIGEMPEHQLPSTILDSEDSTEERTATPDTSSDSLNRQEDVHATDSQNTVENDTTDQQALAQSAPDTASPSQTSSGDAEQPDHVQTNEPETPAGVGHNQDEGEQQVQPEMSDHLATVGETPSIAVVDETFNQESMDTPEDLNAFDVSNSTTGTTSESTETLDQFMVSDTDPSMEEIPPMDGLDVTPEDMPGSEPEDVGLGADDAVLVEDIQDQSQVQEDVIAA